MRDGGNLEFSSKENQITDIIETKLEIKDKKIEITTNFLIFDSKGKTVSGFSKTPLLSPEELEDFSRQLSKIYQIQSHFFLKKL
jgi:hypothetical protein